MGELDQSISATLPPRARKIKTDSEQAPGTPDMPTSCRSGRICPWEAQMNRSAKWPPLFVIVFLAALLAGCQEGGSTTDDVPGVDADASVLDTLLDPGDPATDSHDSAAGDEVPLQDAEIPVTTDAVETTEAGPTDFGALDDTPAADTGADIADPPVCHESVPVQCGDRVHGDTAAIGVLDEWNGYNCSARAESGPEALFVLGTSRDCRVALRLADLEVDLDLFVLDSCDPFTCVANSSLPQDIQDIRGIESTVFDQVAGQFRFLSVDGYANASGTFTLETDCLCGDGAAVFGDGSWQMKVDRRWNNASDSPGSPFDPLDEKDFIQVQDGDTYPVEVSDAWRHVSVGNEPLSGISTPDKTGALAYELNSGTFAGGRFRIWVGPSGLQAERTLYGSGVPIVSSERGPLSMVSPNP
jgi:hypothetical protein